MTNSQMNAYDLFGWRRRSLSGSLPICSSRMTKAMRPRNTSGAVRWQPLLYHGQVEATPPPAALVPRTSLTRNLDQSKCDLSKASTNISSNSRHVVDLHTGCILDNLGITRNESSK
ncbi:hypothetical protein KC19_N045100 [Ceratodon purpureus]|nr:hypothetical protein KC19_N045100 [Ceratodon purpureus]